MIILIRHAQSEGNKNREIHQSIPDHRVKLTAEGHRQAQEAGGKLRDLLRPDDTLHFFTSPYRRTRETTEGILDSLTSDSPSPSPFPRHTIKVYEEPRLREQDFGNFQPCSAEMERMWLERADYGHFFYRIPNGESAADAYDRVSGFNESLWRLFGENDFASVCILVTHGLMTRVFLMKWYHWSVEYFEDLRNINHCEFVVLKLNPDNGKYKLDNQMRTWSELRKQKELERQREHEEKGLSPVPTPSDTHVPVRRTWGGCPDGCNHGIPKRGHIRPARATPIDSHRNGHDGQKTTDTNNQATAQDTSKQESPEQTNIEPALGDRPVDPRFLDGEASLPTRTSQSNSFDQTQSTSSTLSADESNKNAHHHHHHHHHHSTKSKPPLPFSRRPELNNRDSDDHLFHRPRSNFALLQLGGRDGGGSLSGANSLAPSEDERDDHIPKSKSTPAATSAGHQARPSQDLANDGDDEGNGKQAQRLRRSRSHHHHHHHHHHHNHNYPPTGRRNLDKAINADALGDMAPDDTDTNTNIENTTQQETNTDTDTPITQKQENGAEPHEHEHEGASDGNDALEAERQQDQSIRGSVY
ncbi:hypothetical protein AWENTII_001132 [Aspergillus wentii]